MGYVDRMRAKFPVKWGVQTMGIYFQIRSRFMVFVKPKGLLQNGDENHIYRQPLAYLNRYD